MDRHFHAKFQLDTERKPLAACCAVLFALAAPEAWAANSWPVTSCSDSGAGSLRAVVGSPSTVSGDTVDLSGLNSSNCPSSTISLTTGAVAILQSTLTLKGPSNRITVTGYYNGGYMNDRLIDHTGSGGTLYLSDLNLSYSKVSGAGAVYGGCLRSGGNVNLTNVTVFHCLASSDTKVKGGGIYTSGNVAMKYSLVAANSAIASAAGSRNYAGGVWAGNIFTAKSSTISGNSAPGGSFGGVEAGYGATLTSSTISGNTASFGAGLSTRGNVAAPVTITDSTISGNSATGYVGGLFTSANPVTIQNSTIAFNTSVKALPNEGPGVTLVLPGTVDIESSILSNNTYGATESDFSVMGSSTITSNNSIVRASLGTSHPATVSVGCPLLGPLRDNGGPTLTHALMSHSPALGTGNNNAGLPGDQRGPQLVVGTDPYPRESGTTTDVGAYEVQRNDIVFNSGFEGCP